MCCGDADKAVRSHVLRAVRYLLDDARALDLVLDLNLSIFISRCEV